jgi:hypothetical protein
MAGKKAKASARKPAAAAPKPRERDLIVRTPPTEDDRRRAEEVIEKYGWDSLRDPR